MISIIDSIMQQFSYRQEEKFRWDDLYFYKHSDKNIASYFLINCIDCSQFETDEEKLKAELDRLESIYPAGNNQQSEPIKLLIQNLFDNNKEASQIDKNTSTLYLLRFEDTVN